ncbi:MAG TPA: lipoate--protein ligase family protein [Tetragenococcus sp.]|nr:lipoate--protein ligase family protein [Tetragenococcus sp.]
MKTIVLDQTIFNKNTARIPFALTDIFTEFAGKNEQIILHFWQFEKAFILGMKDARVDDLAAGIQLIQAKKYQTIIRNAGGLGVISDKGVLNLSLIFPKNSSSIDNAYEKMFSLMKKTFPELEIKAYEVVHSYCPGKFDLSVKGKKIAGIAQRRVKDGVAVMMYLSVNGDQFARGQMVKQFYQKSLQENYGLKGYPDVKPSSMTTLSAVLEKEISITEVKERFLQTLGVSGPAANALDWIHQMNQTSLFEQKLQQMKNRNQQLEELTNDSFI